MGLIYLYLCLNNCTRPARGCRSDKIMYDQALLFGIQSVLDIFSVSIFREYQG